MKMKTPVQMTDDLAHFIKETREDTAFPHESLYVDLLEQWKVLSRYQLEYADKESKRLYNAYWNSMSHWYKIFDKEREHLLEPTALPSEDLMDFYSGLINVFRPSWVREQSECTKQKTTCYAGGR